MLAFGTNSNINGLIFWKPIYIRNKFPFKEYNQKLLYFDFLYYLSRAWQHKIAVLYAVKLAIRSEQIICIFINVYKYLLNLIELHARIVFLLFWKYTLYFSLHRSLMIEFANFHFKSIKDNNYYELIWNSIYNIIKHIFRSLYMYIKKYSWQKNYPDSSCTDCKSKKKLFDDSLNF